MEPSALAALMMERTSISVGVSSAIVAVEAPAGACASPERGVHSSHGPLEPTQKITALRLERDELGEKVVMPLWIDQWVHSL